VKKFPELRNRRRRLLLEAIFAGVAINSILGRWALAERSLKTIYRTIPGSDETLPLIGLGTSRVFDVGSDAGELQGPREVLSVLAEVQNAMVDTSPIGQRRHPRNKQETAHGG